MDSPLNLQARIKRCRPEHALMGFFFHGALGHLEKLIGGEVVEEIRSQVPCTQEALLPVLSYPASEYLRVLQLGTQALMARGRSFEVAMEELGYGAADGLFALSMGQMVLSAAGKDPHEGLGEVPGVARMVASFGEREYQRVAEGHGRLLLRGELAGPSWVRGLIRAGFERIPGCQARIEVAPEAFVPYLDFKLDLRW
jgi:uncharacterized protein (TIGR02265 family)